MKIKVLERDAISLLQDVAQKLKEGRIPLRQAAEDAQKIQDTHPEMFATKAAARPEPASAGLQFNWNSVQDAASRNAGVAVLDEPEAIQKTYEAVIKAAPGDPSVDQLCDPQSLSEHKALHDLHDGFVMCQALRPGYDPRRSKHWPRYSRLAGNAVRKVLGKERMTKILTTGGSLTGADFIPNTLSGTLIPFYRQKLMLGNLFAHETMPTSPFKVPFEGIDINPYLVAEATDDNPAGVSSNQIPARTKATGQLTLTAAGLKVRTVVSTEAEEDAIISMVGYARAGIAQAIVNGVDDNILNGDTSGTHMDADSNTASDWRHAWLGLRKLTANNSVSKFNNGTNKLTIAKMLNLRIPFGKFGQVPSDLSWIVSNIGLVHICGDTNFARWDATGQTPPIVNGQVGTIYGTPVVVSGYARENLNGAGVYDGSTTTNAIAFLVHRPSFMIWDRRTITIEAMKDIQTDKFIIVATARLTFARMQAEVTSPQLGRNVGYIYNIGTTQQF